MLSFPLHIFARHRGFSLVEVLVALAVISIGLLGVAALQITGIRHSQGSYARSQAVMIANDYAERMYANRPGVNAQQYAPMDSNSIACSSAPTKICGTQSDKATPDVCSPAEMSTYDRFVISCGYPITGGRYGGVKDLLPTGRIQVACVNAANTVATCATGLRHRITVSWQERGTASDGTSALETVQHQMFIQP